jgi:hypothetical protein
MEGKKIMKQRGILKQWIYSERYQPITISDDNPRGAGEVSPVVRDPFKDPKKPDVNPSVNNKWKIIYSIT